MRAMANGVQTAEQENSQVSKIPKFTPEQAHWSEGGTTRTWAMSLFRSEAAHGVVIHQFCYVLRSLMRQQTTIISDAVTHPPRRITFRRPVLGGPKLRWCG